MKIYTATGDISNKKFGQLLGLRESGRSKWSDVMWLFKCDCGNEIELVAARVKRGELSHCGCQYVSYNKTHGLCRTKEYNTWCRMIDRCYNKNASDYNRYGGRGITVCNRWRKSFESFLSDINFAPSKNHTIDRINNLMGYNPSNCRWATRMEQARNRRSNKLVEIDGVTKCIIEWCEFYKMPWHTYKSRKKSGMLIREIFTKPIKRKK